MVKKIKRTGKKDEEGGKDLDDALEGLDEGDVESGKSKPKKIKNKEENFDDGDEESLLVHSDAQMQTEPVKIKESKPISNLKKGDKIKIDGVQMEVDAHYVLIDHGNTKEMALEVFDPKTDRDFQIRYFSDQVERSLEFYELQEILYVKKPCKIVEW